VYFSISDRKPNATKASRAAGANISLPWSSLFAECISPEILARASHPVNASMSMLAWIACFASVFQGMLGIISRRTISSVIVFSHLGVGLR